MVEGCIAGVVLVFLGQVTDPISGGAGWAGAGILGLVLAWLLLVHLPAKDKHIQGLMDKFAESLDKERKDFRDALQYVTERTEWHVGVLADAIRQEFKSINEFIIKRDRSQP